MRRTSRLFELIQFLRSAHRPVTAATLAERLEVSKRTIYRDIVSLQAMTVPIVGEAGIGYEMRRGYELPPLMFSADEVDAVVVALSLLECSSDNGLKMAADTIRGKVAAVLPDALIPALFLGSLYASSERIAEPLSVDLAIVRRSIREERKLKFLYCDGANRPTNRTVCPIALIYGVQFVQIIAWCELRRSFRRFRADRICSCSISNEWFRGESNKLRSQWATECGATTDWS